MKLYNETTRDLIGLFVQSMEKKKPFKRKPKQDEFTDTNTSLEGQTPEEILDSAHTELTQNLIQELLDNVKTCSPQFFEKLVVELLLLNHIGSPILI